MADATKKSGSGCIWFILGVAVLAVIGGLAGGGKRDGAGVALHPSPPAAIWNESVDSTGKKQRWMAMSFDACVATRATTIANLNVSPDNVIEIVNTAMVTVTRLCLSDGSSLLITCSAPDARMVVVESPHRADAGCPS